MNETQPATARAKTNGIGCTTKDMEQPEGRSGAGEGSRTLDLLHGKQTLYH